MPDNPLNDTGLLTRLAAGDHEAFTQLYVWYSPGVYNAVMTYVKDEDQADDLLQNVFLKVWEKRKELTVVEDLENYLFILARNMTLSLLRRRATEGKIHRVLQRSLEHPADPTGNRMLESDYSRLIQEAVDALPAQQKQVYLLATEASLSYEEIADSMSLSRLTVKKHLELARKSIRSYLNARLHGISGLPFILISTFLLGK